MRGLYITTNNPQHKVGGFRKNNPPIICLRQDYGGQDSGAKYNDETPCPQVAGLSEKINCGIGEIF
jgi:hypothetical protein